MKELTAKVEDCTENNEEASKKLREETEKLDNFVDQYEEIAITHKNQVAFKEETTEKIKE